MSHIRSSQVDETYRHLAGLRRDDPVHRHPDGYWIVTRYEDVSAALSDPHLSNRPAPFALLHARNRDRHAAADVAANLIAFRDAPDHSAPRRALSAAFGALLAGCDAPLSAIAARLSGEVLARDKFDLVADFARPFAEQSSAALMGFPPEDARRIAAWSNDFFRLFHVVPDRETFAQVNASVTAFRAYVDDRIPAPGAGTGPGFLQLCADHAGAELTPREMADNIMLIASDAIENVRAGLAACALALLDHPGLIGEALGSDAVMRGVIDEAMRLEAPGQFQGRITTAPVRIGGRDIPSHALVLLSFAAANRDPDAFHAPDDFAPGRRGRRPLSFGGGRHACLGAALVYREFSIALRALFGGGCGLASGREGPVWDTRFGHRWLAALPVEVEA